MIEENTVKLAEVAGPSLDELGLAPQEQRQLEKLGVRNAAQLQRLNTSSGEEAVARFADVPVNRLRAALQAGSPTVRQIQPEPSAGCERLSHREPCRRFECQPAPAGCALDGRNLSELATAGSARLDGAGVAIVDAGPDHAVIDLGRHEPTGRLELKLDDRVSMAFQLSAERRAGVDQPGPCPTLRRTTGQIVATVHGGRRERPSPTRIRAAHAGPRRGPIQRAGPAGRAGRRGPSRHAG